MNNYTTHALEFFRTHPYGHAHITALPRSRDGIMAVLGMMEEGQKFIMPDYGRVFENGTRRGDFRDLLHLPYPTCILEYFCPERIVGPQAPASAVREDTYFPKRRIAILTDTRHLEGFDSTVIGNSILVFACFEAADGVWTFAPAGGLLNPDTVEVDPETGLFTVDTVPFLQEVYHRPEYTPEEKIYDIADEITAAVEFMMTINCENVTRERVAPSAKLNKKRVANGKVPMFDYWILNVFKEVAERGKHQGGTHASPRFHFRRRHIRRYRDDAGNIKFTRIIDRMAVGNPERGMVAKDYKINPMEKS